uniref:Dynein light chain n=1 Tax=Megaselia scalaris TaxID=36166 RepID=T1H6J0_MEGSC
PVLRYAPTYRLESKKPFNREKAENVIKKVLEENLEDFVYGPKHATNLCKHISEEIKIRIKYKYVCFVTIGEKFLQDNCMMNFLWDSNNDGFLTHLHETPEYFVLVTFIYTYYD